MDNKGLGIILCVSSIILLISILFYKADVDKRNQHFCSIACSGDSPLCKQVDQCPFVQGTPPTLLITIMLSILTAGLV